MRRTYLQYRLARSNHFAGLAMNDSNNSVHRGNERNGTQLSLQQTKLLLLNFNRRLEALNWGRQRAIWTFSAKGLQSGFDSCNQVSLSFDLGVEGIAGVLHLLESFFSHKLAGEEGAR